MRAIITIAALAVFALPLPSYAQETSDDDSDVAASDEEPAEDEGNREDDADQPDRGEAIRKGWAAVFAPPGEHLWEVELAWGAMFWETAFGGSETEDLYRLRARRYLRDPLAVSLGVDFTRQAPETGTLEFTQQRTTLLASVDLHHWFGRWLLGASAEAGPQWNRRTIDDATGEVDTSNRFEPALGLVGRAGVSIFGTASLSLEGGLRWYPKRLDKLFVVQLGWLL
ncbi:MAG: hypothetical protein ACLFVJ_22585 [Persicimonas sp.]